MVSVSLPGPNRSPERRDRCRIGITSAHHGTYPTIRLGAIRAADLLEAPLFPMGTRFTRHSPRLRGLVKSVGLARPSGHCDLLHSYQQILLNRRPWIVSYDALMPFYPKPYISQRVHDTLFGILARDECRALLPHSENALKQLKARNAGSPRLDAVLRKTTVVYPAVADDPALAEKCLRRDMREGVRILFVGRQFFIKGGHLAADVASRLKTRYPVAMTVVSSLSVADWTTDRHPSLVARWRGRLAAAGIEHFVELDNRRVRELMAESDILVLPSIDETFGFVLLEALATGLAVVATRIRAVPEVVTHGQTGLLLPCEVDAEGRMVRDGHHEERISEQLEAALTTLLENPVTLSQMKQQARKRYLERFTVERLAADLDSVYRASVH